MRLTFPQDRTTFLFQGEMEPILEPPRTGIQFFTDAQAQHSADMLWPDDQSPSSSSTVYTGEDGLIPEFLGPEDVLLLWARVLDTPQVYPVQPRVTDLAELLVHTVPPPVVVNEHSLVAVHGNPTASDGNEGGFALDLDASPPALWGPKQPDGSWPINPMPLGTPPGPTTVDHVILEPSTEVTIDHNLFYPSVTYIDEDFDESYCDVSYPVPTRVVVRFGSPSLGRLRLTP